MGPFSRKATAPETDWQPDGLGVTEYDDAGENEAGDRFGPSYRLAFVSSALPGRSIVVSFCAVQYASWESDEWGVDRTVEWSIADRPGEDPWFEDSDTGLVNETAIDTQAEADTLAARFADEDDSDAGANLYGTWDGEPFEPGA